MSALWTAQRLLAATGGRLTRPFQATGVSIDTRTLRSGDLFVALVGEHGDGHAHVGAAFEKGAAGALVHRLPEGLHDDAPLLQVSDTLAGLGALAAFARARFTGRLVAVTGSVGKTTTKEMLRTILTAQGKTWAAEASHNNHWGVPLTLARLPPGHRFCVVEIGMNHAGEIAPLARLARPDVAIITNVAAVHIGHLGSIEAIAAEKLSICEGLGPDGTLVLPDCRDVPETLLRDSAPRIVRFGWHRQGIDEPLGVQLLSSLTTGSSNSVLLRADGQECAFTMNAPGEHMAENAAAATAAAVTLGIDASAAAAALEGFAPLAGRGQQRPIDVPGGTALLLDESYNASPVAVRAALEVLKHQASARRIMVFGDMLELGEQGVAEHLGLAPAVTDSADLMFFCGPFSRHLFDLLIRDEKPAVWRPDSTALAPIVAAALRPGDAVLVKGSLGSRMAVIVRTLERVRG